MSYICFFSQFYLENLFYFELCTPVKIQPPECVISNHENNIEVNGFSIIIFFCVSVKNSNLSKFLSFHQL